MRNNPEWGVLWYSCLPYCSETSRWYHPIPLFRLISKDCSILGAPGLTGCRRRHPNSLSAGELKSLPPISSCTLTTATSFILNCSKSDSFVTCLKTFPQTGCLSYSRLLPSFTSVRADWLVAPRWSHHRAAVKPIKRWIFRHHLYTLAQIGRKQLFHWKEPFEHIEITFDPSESFCPDHLRSLSQRYRIFLPASPQILFHICVITLKSRHVQATTYRSVEVHLLSPTSTDDCWYCCW